jgi:hypothetical protein
MLGICGVCETGYNLINGKCILNNIINCLIYVDKNTCKSCIQGYTLVNGKCSNDNCVQYLNGICITCN